MNPSTNRFRVAALAIAGATAAIAAAPAQAEEKFVYMTNWFAEAEHGGFYQAVATGTLQEGTAST